VDEVGVKNLVRTGDAIIRRHGMVEVSYSKYNYELADGIIKQLMVLHGVKEYELEKEEVKDKKKNGEIVMNGDGSPAKVTFYVRVLRKGAN